MASADIKQLQELVKAVSAIRRAGFRQGLVRALAQTMKAEVMLTFEESQDLYGKKWKPLKATSGRRVGGMPLLDTSNLRNSINVRVMGSSRFVIGTNVKYAAVHQYGYNKRTQHKVRKTGKLDKNGRYRKGRVKGLSKKYRAGIPARPYLPDRRGFPKAMARQFSFIITKSIERHIIGALTGAALSTR